MAELLPVRCYWPGCDGVYDECRRRLRCPECRRIYFGVVRVPADRPDLAHWHGLVVTADVGGLGMGWAHPDEEGVSLTCPDSWVRPVTWDEYPAAAEAERTFWDRQAALYAADGK